MTTPTATLTRIPSTALADTAHLPPVERLQRMRAMMETVATGDPATVGELYRALEGERAPNGFNPPKVVALDGFTYTYRVTR